MKDKKIYFILFFFFVTGTSTAWIFNPGKTVPRFNQDFGLRNIELQVSSGKLWKLKNQRDAAVKTGFLSTKTEDWVKGELVEGVEKTKIELRLKNDGSNHLKSDKWSFRIRTTDNKAWSGLRSFSLQNPAAKNHLDEWVFHQALLGEEVLSPRYDFLRVFLNGKFLGIFSIEEHYSDELLYAQNRIIAPILRFDDESFSYARTVISRTGNNEINKLPFVQAAPIASYDSKDQKTEKFKGWIKTGQLLLNQFRYASGNCDEIFDLQTTATALALCDLFQENESMAWQNQRFYYNPLNGKLEVIISGSVENNSRELLSGNFLNLTKQVNDSNAIHQPASIECLWKNQIFVQMYYRELWRMSDPSYLTNLLDALKENLKIRQSIIREESPFYKFDATWISKNAKEIRKILESDEKYKIQPRPAG